MKTPRTFIQRPAPRLLLHHHVLPSQSQCKSTVRRQSTTTTTAAATTTTTTTTTTATSNAKDTVVATYSQPPGPTATTQPPLAVLPTKSLIRSLIFTTVMSSPLLEPCLALMKLVVNAKTPILKPSQNPPLNYLLRSTIYDHFCAGTNEAEVRRTVREMKEVGFRGVILGYAREVVVGHGKEESAESDAASRRDAEEARLVREWMQGNLKTLSMIGSGDFLSMKFTGAGSVAVDALNRGDPIPPSVWEAMRAICEQAARQGSRLWIDAEQQVFQDTIDAWTIELMRTYNRNGNVVVYNTIQAYLKASAENVQRHLIAAQKEGWTLGIKLVRGAYIAHDVRSRIHDTQEDTDNNYNNIVEKLVTKQFPLPLNSKSDNNDSLNLPFPDVRLMVATHNSTSVRKATTLHRSRIIQNKPTIPVEFGQLQGMADEISCELVSQSKKANHTATNSGDSDLSVRERIAVPKAFKALAWGTTEECLHFLLRRAVENKGAVQRTRHMAAALREEAWRRMFRNGNGL